MTGTAEALKKELCTGVCVCVDVPCCCCTTAGDVCMSDCVCMYVGLLGVTGNAEAPELALHNDILLPAPETKGMLLPTEYEVGVLTLDGDGC